MPIPQRGHTNSINALGVNSGDPEFLFDYGRIYLVCEKRLDRTLRILQEFHYSGSKTLCVTRLHPDLLQERMPGMTVESAWLSERYGINNIPPNQLQRISQRIGSFLLGKKNAVVLLEGIEYLATFNDFLKVQMFLENVNDQIMSSKAILLVPLDPESMDMRSMAKLRRFAEVVAPQYGAL
ncbi:MAG: DUF835 domain-containing protein [Methanomassiliicoccus sp.]|nr:DUF835 domain-containing protein [Methanomassiliicoccus sp.]